MKFHSKPIAEHEEVPLADEGRWEDLIAHWNQRQTADQKSQDGRNSCYVVSVAHSKPSATENSQLAEILSLVEAQGDQVVGQEVHHLRRPDPRTLIGRGICEDIAERSKACGADLLVIDAEVFGRTHVIKANRKFEEWQPQAVRQKAGKARAKKAKKAKRIK